MTTGCFEIELSNTKAWFLFFKRVTSDLHLAEGAVINGVNAVNQVSLLIHRRTVDDDVYILTGSER